ncbi:MAG: ThuA domain-containing protein [Actinobacteria bacterium]|nr:ThuA domain-containing protein [Actinomycetota bacterium]
MSYLVYLSDVAPYLRRDGSREVAGVHQSLGSAALAVEELAGLNGLGFHHVQHTRDLDKDLLAGARVLCLFTIGETAWSAEQRLVIERRFGAGDLGFMGIHSATDSAYEWQGFEGIIGARFDSHPVTGRLPISVVDPGHPAVAHLRSPWWFEDELYLFRQLSRDAKILLAIDPQVLADEARGLLRGALQAKPTTAGRERLPLSWCLEKGSSRSFYTSLGHFVGAYEDTRFLRHLDGALSWLLGAGG